MKNTSKTHLLFALIVVITVTLATVPFIYAQSTASKELVSGNTLVLDHGGVVTSVTVTSTSAVNGTVEFYDNAQTNTTHVIPEHTARNIAAGFVTNVFKTTVGLMQTNINPVLVQTVVTNSAVTNSLPMILKATVPAGATVIYEVPLNLALGLTAKADTTNLVVDVTYRPKN